MFLGIVIAETVPDIERPISDWLESCAPRIRGGIQVSSYNPWSPTAPRHDWRSYHSRRWLWRRITVLLQPVSRCTQQSQSTWCLKYVDVVSGLCRGATPTCLRTRWYQISTPGRTPGQYSYSSWLLPHLRCISRSCLPYSVQNYEDYRPFYSTKLTSPWQSFGEDFDATYAKPFDLPDAVLGTLITRIIYIIDAEPLSRYTHKGQRQKE